MECKETFLADPLTFRVTEELDTYGHLVVQSGNINTSSSLYEPCYNSLVWCIGCLPFTFSDLVCFPVQLFATLASEWDAPSLFGKGSVAIFAILATLEFSQIELTLLAWCIGSLPFTPATRVHSPAPLLVKVGVIHELKQENNNQHKAEVQLFHC